MERACLMTAYLAQQRREAALLPRQRPSPRRATASTHVMGVPARNRASRLLDAVVPHERNVFELLDASADTGSHALALLERLVHHWPDATDLQTALADGSRRADEQAEAVFAHVHRSFVTALEREDILALADALRSVVAHAEAVSGLLDAYRVGHTREAARRLTHLLAGAGEQLRDGVSSLRRLDGLATAVVDLHEADRAGRHGLRAAVADLVAEEPDARELVAWKDIYEELGGVLDAVAAAARVLHAVELKGR